MDLTFLCCSSSLRSYAKPINVKLYHATGALVGKQLNMIQPKSANKGFPCLPVLVTNANTITNTNSKTIKKTCSVWAGHGGHLPWLLLQLVPQEGRRLSLEVENAIIIYYQSVADSQRQPLIYELAPHSSS